MYNLKYNSLRFSKEELIEIEKCSKEKHKISLALNVLDKSQIELYGYLLSLFMKLNMDKEFGLCRFQLLDFIVDVSNHYSLDPSYHTFYHAADTVTMVYYFCLRVKYLSRSDKIYLIIAALCHDLGHPGYNNQYQINANTEIAQHYGELSTLETYSVDLALKLLNKHKISFKNMKTVISNLILSTDMANHSNLVNELDQLKPNNKLNLCRILLHAADISNMCRPWKISKQWSDLVIKEFFNQGDEEKKKQLNVSPCMDRDLLTQQDISIGFAKLIQPFFELLVEQLPELYRLYDNLVINQSNWVDIDKITLSNNRIRSQSYPTIVFKSRYHRNASIEKANLLPVLDFTVNDYMNDPPIIFKSRYHHNAIIEKVNLLPVLDFTTYSFTTNDYMNDPPIVFYHPYDV